MTPPSLPFSRRQCQLPRPSLRGNVQSLHHLCSSLLDSLWHVRGTGSGEHRAGHSSPALALAVLSIPELGQDRQRHSSGSGSILGPAEPSSPSPQSFSSAGWPPCVSWWTRLFLLRCRTLQFFLLNFTLFLLALSILLKD